MGALEGLWQVDNPQKGCAHAKQIAFDALVMSCSLMRCLHSRGGKTRCVKIVRSDVIAAAMLKYNRRSRLHGYVHAEDFGL